MKKYLFSALFFPFIVLSQIPAGYYNGTSGLSGYALKTKLHQIISANNFNYNYSQLPGFYATTDRDLYYENNSSLLDIYSENPAGPDSYEYNFSQLTGSASSEGVGYNREHGIPQSNFYGIYPMYSDLHYVIPADAFVNQKRSNYPYARNNGNNTVFSNGSKLGNSTTPGYSNLVYEPIDEFKGDVARYLLYFVTRYEGSLNSFNFLISTSPLDGNEEKGFEDWYITMLKEWNSLDPVSQREIDRNNYVYNIQKVRNPFVDHPEWVNLIWNEATDATPPLAPLNLTSTSVGESFVTVNWQPTTDTDVLGYKIYVDGVYRDYTKGTSFTVDRLQPSTSYNITVKAYDKGYLLSTDSNTVSETTLASDALARDLMITKYIEGTTSSTSNTYNNALEITNKTGHEVKLNNYYLSIQFKGANDTYYFSDAYKLEGTILPGESKVVINPFASFTNFTVQQADVVTAGTPMTYTGTQYIELSYGTKYLKTVSTNNYDISFSTVDAVGYKNTTNALGNMSIYRNTNVTDPNTTFTWSEWTQYPINYTDGLGVDAVLSANDLALNEDLRIYPNPVTEGILYVSGKNHQKIGSAVVYDMSGRMVFETKNPFRNVNYLNLTILKSGNYILKLDQKSFKIITQ